MQLVSKSSSPSSNDVVTCQPYGTLHTASLVTENCAGTRAENLKPVQAKAPAQRSISNERATSSAKKTFPPIKELNRLIGTEVIASLCKSLIYAAYNEECNFVKEWEQKQEQKRITIENMEQTKSNSTQLDIMSEKRGNGLANNSEQQSAEERFTVPKPFSKAKSESIASSPKTPPTKGVNSNGNEPSPDTLSLLCEEDDTLTKEQQEQLKKKKKKKAEDVTRVSPPLSKKGYDHSLQVTLEVAILTKFKEFLQEQLETMQ